MGRSQDSGSRGRFLAVSFRYGVPTLSLLPLTADAELVTGLVHRHRLSLAAAYPAGGTYQADALARQLASGALSALLWKPAGREATGIVWFEALPEGDRIHGLWLEPMGVDPLTRFLEEFARERSRIPAAVTDLLPGIPDASQTTLFEGRGFWHRSKVLMRWGPKARAAAPGAPPQLRPVEPADLSDVVEVYVHAYGERPGEFWTWNRDDRAAREEAVTYVGGHATGSGSWAPNFLADASFVWVEEGRILGAVLVVRGKNGVPWVDDLIVEPTAQRRGIGRALLERTLDRLSGTSPGVVELAAIRFGAPFRLYRRLGFEEDLTPSSRLDGHWVRGRSPF